MYKGYRFNIPYFDIIASVLTVAIVAGIVIWHYSEVDDAFEDGILDQVQDTNDATTKTLKGLNDAAETTKTIVDDNSNADNIKLLTESIPTIPVTNEDGGDTTMSDMVGSTTDDRTGQNEPKANESLLYKVDDTIRVEQEELRKGVQDECEQITYEPEFGYILNSDCVSYMESLEK